jgi:predicted phage terminase large subunit-like protein
MTFDDLRKIPGIAQMIKAEARAEIARRSFWDFCLAIDPDFFHRRPFLKEIAQAMQDVAEGKINRLAISLPPRAGKSYLASCFSTWMLGNHPSGAIMRNTCTATLYQKFSYDTRAIILSDRYRSIFPTLALAPDKQNLNGWNTDKAIQVSYFGAGVGGTIIGFGATLVAITDDLFRSFEDAISETIRDKTQSWYQGNHVSRMEKGCPAIDIGTRWSKKDIIGQNLDTGYYDRVIAVAALTPDQKSFCEDVKTTAEYLDLQTRTPKEIWCAEYQQKPIEAAGTLFVKEELKRFSLAQLRQKLTPVQINGSREKRPEIQPDAVLGYIDVADEGTDRLAFAVGVIIGANIYLTDVVFTSENIDVTLPLCVATINTHQVDYTRVEGNNQGSAMIKMLRDHIDASRILKVTNTANKHSRILMQYGIIKHHFHFIQDSEILKGGPYDQFLQEVLEYSKTGASKHDDAPDALAGLAKFVTSFLPHLFSPKKAESQEHGV